VNCSLHPAICTLVIGGLRLAVECDDAALAESLCRRYSPFMSSGRVHLHVRVHLNGTLRTGMPDPTIVFSAGLVRFTTPGYEGFINTQQGEGELWLSCAQPVDEVEYYLRVACALLAFQSGGLLFHAAGIVRDGRAHVFFGHSGSGKTTVARLSSDAIVLNDDLLLLMPAESGNGWRVHATPFWNPTQVSPAGALSAPLAGMFRLVQDTRVFLEAMEPGQALAELVASVPVISADSARLTGLLERGWRLIGAAPVYRLHFVPDASFWAVIPRPSTFEP
jgi:hypothetical protein